VAEWRQDWVRAGPDRNEFRLGLFCASGCCDLLGLVGVSPVRCWLVGGSRTPRLWLGGLSAARRRGRRRLRLLWRDLREKLPLRPATLVALELLLLVSWWPVTCLWWCVRALTKPG